MPRSFGAPVRGGSIYKRRYRGLYCVGCEEFKTEKDLVNGHCPEHPTATPEVIEEENYFFRLSAYQGAIQELITSARVEVIPEARRNEILAFINQGLQDFSISRSRERAHGIGVPVPGDDSQVQYVWFDALTNYVNALGYAADAEPFRRYWQNGGAIIHVIGKGVARFHAVHWPAMLLSAGLALPKQIFIHGYITVNGQKISKSLGNIIIPKEIVTKYGTDPIRYYLLREVSPFDDGDFSETKLVERYNGDLANGLGNLVSRVAALGEKISPIQCDFKRDISQEAKSAAAETSKKYERAFLDIRLNEALAEIWRLIGVVDRYINETKPWAAGDSDKFREIIANSAFFISTIANLIRPFLPQTADRIAEQIRFEDSAIHIKRGAVLFPRLDA